MRTAHRFAMANPNIVADMVEVTEFPQLAVKYGVQGVPMTVINETGKVTGAVPDEALAQQILQALGK